MKNLLWISVIAILVILTVTSCSKKDDDFNPGNTDTTKVVPNSITINATISIPEGVKLSNSELKIQNDALKIGKSITEEQGNANSLQLIISGEEVNKYYNQQMDVTIGAVGKNAADQHVTGTTKLSLKLDKSSLSLNNVSLSWN